MSKVFASLSVLALMAALASPMAAQSVRLKASVPFDFMVGTSTLPAGDYEVNTLDSTGIMSVRDESGNGVTSALVLSISATNTGAQGKVLLVFHRYGDQYFLSQVWDGKSAGRAIPMSQTEREISKRASVRQPESVMILARL